jgi:hypothetical protein
MNFMESAGTEVISLNIPFRLTIGVTGHRELKNEEELRETVQRVIDQILQSVPGTLQTKVRLCVLTPLAEGADRLVAEEVLRRDQDVFLKVILPFVLSDYLEDFTTEASREEFTRLLSKDRSPLSLRKIPLRDEFPPELLPAARRQAYEDVGRYIVRHSDVMIALWEEDLKGGQGGTARTVDYAREVNCPVYVINPNRPSEFRMIRG